jgi:hypothetical protein
MTLGWFLFGIVAPATESVHHRRDRDVTEQKRATAAWITAVGPPSVLHRQALMANHVAVSSAYSARLPSPSSAPRRGAKVLGHQPFMAIGPDGVMSCRFLPFTGPGARVEAADERRGLAP